MCTMEVKGVIAAYWAKQLCADALLEKEGYVIADALRRPTPDSSEYTFWH